MWAQCLGHKNTSRVQPPQRKGSPSALFLVSPSSWLEQRGRRLLLSSDALECTRTRDTSLFRCSESVSFGFSITLKCERKRQGGNLSSHRRKGGFSWREARRIHPEYRSTALGKEAMRDSWAAAPPLTQPTSLTLLCPPSSPPASLPPGYPFWPRKSPDPALRVC